jgi:hypothetical protein
LVCDVRFAAFKKFGRLGGSGLLGTKGQWRGEREAGVERALCVWFGMGENSRFWLLAFGRAEKLEAFMSYFVVAKQEGRRAWATLL